MYLTNSNLTTAPLILDILSNMKLEEIPALSQKNEMNNDKNYKQSTSLKTKVQIKRSAQKKLTDFCIQTDSKLKLKIKTNKLKKIERSTDFQVLKEVKEENERFSQYASSKNWDEEIKVKISLNNLEKYIKKESMSILLPESGDNINEYRTFNLGKV